MPKSILYLNAPGLIPPKGHYSHCVTANGFVFISGQLPVDHEGNPRVDLPFKQQAELVLENVTACLDAAGIAKKHLVQVRVYILNMDNWNSFNQVYAQWIGEYRPARAVAGVSELHFGAELEIEVTAVSA
ncbi:MULTISPECIES: RidA family protein [Providencia]|uniref:RidA family protein n=1 Tax=Providencia TaxID=586 RepID=UPI0008386AA4|nr:MULTISPECIES: RidA family protein [Providencia]MBP6123412.1 RidA family protein [Providencia sp.]NIH22738.1 RidA family protein [Providencia heimbachae]